jgi:hypothetical protein
LSLARPLNRVFHLDFEHCLNCGSESKIIATIVEQPVIEKIFEHLSLEPQPQPKAAAREAVPHFAG